MGNFMGSRRFVTLEGVVTFVGDHSLRFREDEAAHEIVIPISQIEDIQGVEVGDTQIAVTAWIVAKLEEEGRR
jgi:hypothetical protein